MPTQAEHLSALGRQVVSDGRLIQLQTRLQFSASMMAELLLVSRTAYRAWFSRPDRTLRPEFAERVGRFYGKAVAILGELREEGIDLDSMVPAHLVANQLGWPLEHLIARCREGKVDALDLDVIGIWLDATEVDRLKRERRSVVA